MSITKMVFMASVMSAVAITGASAQGQGKTTPEGNYIPQTAPSVAPPIAQTPGNGNYVPHSVAPSKMPAPVGETPANGDYPPKAR